VTVGLVVLTENSPVGGAQAAHVATVARFP